MHSLDPRLFGAPNGGAQHAGSPNDVIGKLWAELTRLSKIVSTNVWGDIQMLTKAIDQLNRGVELALKQQNGAIAALSQRVAQLEGILAQIVRASGGTVERSADAGTVDADVVEAANARPGDENLPPEYFEGSNEEDGP